MIVLILSAYKNEEFVVMDLVKNENFVFVFLKFE